MDVDSLSERLGRYAIGASRDLQAAAEMAAGERLEAIVTAVWKRRGYVAVATDAGLRLARRPRLFGRAHQAAFEWRDLTAVDSTAQRAFLTFGTAEVSFLATPHDEFVKLIETARLHLHGDAKPPVDELRELARRKLGRTLAFGFEPLIDGLPDRLEPDERVERLAGAKLEFEGLLVVTDRRLLLLNAPFRRANQRVWAIPRGRVLGAESVEDGLRLVLEDADDVTLTDFLPPERRDELAVVLHRPSAAGS
jgi:hypothetical protein